MLTGPAVDAAGEGVAIIGMAGRFPRAANVDELWRNVREARDCVSFFTDEELIADGIDGALVRHPRYVKARAALDGVELFDASFFGYTPKEALAMDPQQRLFLECAWTALEHAGYYGEGCEAPIGVYAGLSLNSYMLAHLASHPEVAAPIAADKDYLATRVSYKLNLKGPSLVIQTACSTSLVAVCQACQGLLTYQCDLALAGGMSVVVPNRAGYFYFDGGIYAPDGRCRPFDAGAQGTVPGSGGGVVVLKRLADALADGDTIHAVIRGFAVNNDGAGKIGYTAPSVEGQAQVIQMAQALAGVSADTITYLEAHGTGTVLGDPIEIAALTQAFRATTDRTGYCAIGSLKSNIGHLDAAAGIASLIKTALALRHRTLPPTLHFERPNPNIDFPASPFYVNTSAQDWPSFPFPRRAGVSSFGIGGTNAHVVLEEAPSREPSGAARRDQLIVLSANSPAALEAATRQLASRFATVPDTGVADAAYTLQVGRKPLPYRRAVVCGDAADARIALETPARRTDGALGARPPGVVFMFPGQGAQHPGMGAALYADEPVFRAALDRCAERFEPALAIDLRRLLYDVAPDDPQAERDLTRTSRAQAALFATEYALAQLWMSWGITPSAMIGHSIGEIVAACLSGVLTLDGAVKLVAARGLLMEEAPPGAMLALAVDERRAQDLLGDGLWLAAVNAPGLCVIAGDRTALAGVRELASREGIHAQPLHTSGAFHSGLMAGIADALTAVARSLPFGEIRIPYVSNVTGAWMEPADVRDPRYWARHVCETVRFSEGVRLVAASGSVVFLEVGPGQTLGRLVRSGFAAAADAGAPSVISSMRSPGEPGDDRTRIVEALGRLWTCGVAPDWTRYHAGERRHRVALPTYPFESKRYWYDRTAEPAASAVRLREAAEAHPAPSIADCFYLPSWKRSLPPPARVRSAAGAERYLVLGCGDDLERELAARLATQGEVIVARPGSRFEALADGTYVVDPASPADGERLLRHLREAGLSVTDVVHLWACDRDGDAGPSERANDPADLHFFSLLHLAQAIGALGGDPLRMTVVTSGVLDVIGTERLRPERALALGPCRVIPQEYPGVVCRLVDVVRDGDERSGAAALAACIAAEVSSHGEEPVVAYRGIDRWTESFEKVRIDAARPEAGRLPPGGTYLITGGLGGVGLAIATHLAQRPGARLVLTSREGLPPRDGWEERLARAGTGRDRLADRIRAVQALERSGATVMVARADVCDDIDMRGVLDRARAAFGRIDGVVHAAGVPAAGVMQLKTRDRCAAVLAPKVRGAATLLRLLASEPPDLVVLCSSLASLVGGIGQVDYCAANAFLDAAARAHSRTGMRVLSINWDRWRDAGMAVESGLVAPANGSGADAVRAGLSSADGVEAFSRAIGAGRVAQIAVSTTDFREWMARSSEGAAAQRASLSAGAPKHPRPKLQNPYVAPTNDVQASVCDEWQHVLGVHPIGIHDSFFDLGGHSVLAIELVARVNRRFATTIPVAALYDGLTPAFLAARVQSSSGHPADEAPADLERRVPRPRPRRQAQRRITRRERNVTS